jgi:hypothetical protein
MQKLRIFAASPSDMAAERARIEAVALTLKPLADSQGIVLEVVDWGSVVPGMGRPEQVILDQVEPSSWDIFIGILWHRFGTPPGESDKRNKQEYLSGTEEEFRTAYQLWQDQKRPRIMIYRCKRSIPPEDLNPEQYKRVQEFFGQFEALGGSNPGLYQSFSTARSFEKLLFDNLQKILLEYGMDRVKEKVKGQPAVEQKTSLKKVFICYKRLAKDDRALAEFLRDRLTGMGHQVFIDTSMRMGTEWLREIDKNIQSSDYLIVLISKDSADSEMVQAEMLRAYEYRNRNGKPKPLPVRLNYEGLLPYTISAFLGGYQRITWKDSQDSEFVLGEIARVMGTGAEIKPAVPEERPASGYFSEDGRPLQSREEKVRPLPGFDPRFLADLEEPGGSIRLGDYFYVEREADERLKRAILKKGETITIRASRQTGKSSLLARGIHHAHNTGSIVYIDLQSIEHAEFESASRFLNYFARQIVRKLRMDIAPVAKIWQEALGPQDKLVKVIEDYVLPESERQIVLAIDEADRLLTVPFQNDFFALMRSWHNNRAIDPLWNKLNLAMVIATEPYLLISNPNQSPFNVGVKINLEDFSREQVWDLNHRHGDPIREGDREDFFKLLSGHPYLTRKALYLLVSEDWTWVKLYDQAADDTGPFADHLRHQLWFIQEDPALRAALRQVLQENRTEDNKVLWRLSRAGLVKGIGDLYYCRCGLYERYFKEHLK